LETVERIELSGAVAYRGAKGHVVLGPLPRHGLVAILSGYVDDPLAEKVISETVALAGRGAVTAFFDTAEMSGYTTRLRTGMTDAVKKHALAVHVLVRSKIVAMGVSIANLALGGTVKSYSDLKSFDTQLQAVLGEDARRTIERLRTAL
jgi:hypothetical protein